VGKRGNGDGSVRQRADGSWEARLTTGQEAGRQRRRSVYGRTRREAVAKLKEGQRRLEDGEQVADHRGTLGAFLERWITEALPASGLKITTIENYTVLTRRHIIPQLGHHRLEALSAADVQRWITAKRSEGLSDRTVQLSHAVLRRALGQAVRWGEARRNVAALVDRPRVRRHEATYLSPEAAQQFLDAARGDRLEAFYAVAIACGLRRGEALAMRWSDVDFDHGTVRIARTLSRTKAAGLMFTEPKSDRSRRRVPLPLPCVEQLRCHRARQLEERLRAGSLWVDHDLVFPSALGTPLDPRNALRACHAVAARAGLPRVRLHVLRHTCASLLLAQGVHPRVAPLPPVTPDGAPETARWGRQLHIREITPSVETSNPVMETLGHAGIARHDVGVDVPGDRSSSARLRMPSPACSAGRGGRRGELRLPPRKQNSRRPSDLRLPLSGRQDLNLRPLDPQSSALPSCATSRVPSG
jgi:integrase